jgi:hypothetical protein
MILIYNVKKIYKKKTYFDVFQANSYFEKHSAPQSQTQVLAFYNRIVFEIIVVVVFKVFFSLKIN